MNYVSLDNFFRLIAVCHSVVPGDYYLLNDFKEFLFYQILIKIHKILNIKPLHQMN